MFSGLNSFFKRFLPKGLFYRSLIIVAAPTILLQLIVTIVMMPGQNGYELVKEIKKDNCPPIILLTAKGEVENRIKGLELGVDDYIGKPFEPKELLLRINNIISKNVKIDLEKKYSVGQAVIDLNKMIIKLNNSERKN